MHILLLVRKTCITRVFAIQVADERPTQQDFQFLWEESDQALVDTERKLEERTLERHALALRVQELDERVRVNGLRTRTGS